MNFTGDTITLPEDHPARSKDLPWYNPHISKSLRPSMRRLLESWSKVDANEVEAHIHTVRDSAWNVFPWPCVGQFWFLEQGLSRHPDYGKVLTLLTDPSLPLPTFLDVGTCLGQDLRTLASDGVSTERLFGADMLPEFERIGHMLFQDDDRFLHSQFICGNLFSNNAQDQLRRTRGSWSIVHLSMFLHIFGLEDQVKACTRVLDLLREPDAFVLGTQTGSLDAGELVLGPPYSNVVVYRHNRETMMAMWEKAAEISGKCVRIDVRYDHGEALGGQRDPQGRFFSASRDVVLFFRVDWLS